MARKMKMLGLAGVAVLALTAFVGVGSASAAQWKDNGSPISTPEATSMVDDGNGLTLADAGGSFGSVTVLCKNSGTNGTPADGTAGPGSADTVTTNGSYTCVTKAGTCGSPTASMANLSWDTNLSSLTEDDITGGGSGNPGWSVTCTVLGFRVTVTCTRASTPVTVGNIASPVAGVEGTFNPSTDSSSCSDGGTGTVSGNVYITLQNGHALSVGS